MLYNNVPAFTDCPTSAPFRPAPDLLQPKPYVSPLPTAFTDCPPVRPNSPTLLQRFPSLHVTLFSLTALSTAFTAQANWNLFPACLSLTPPPTFTDYSPVSGHGDIHRQNQITQQILTQYLQRRLFPHNHAPPNTNITDKIPNVTDRELDEELESRSSENLGNSGGGECSNCIDDSTAASSNRWSMPLLKSGEKRYYLNIFFKANWYRASQYCRYHGMHLASIASQDENDKLEKHIRDFGLGHEHFWISGTDQAEEGTFFWMATGKPITFTNWNAGEPNNFRYENGEEEHCLELWNRDGKGMKWNDSPCSFETYFVCEL
ncbi:hypothetical protein M8J76_007740 [Diaphorina citri]|nr:hypothetical protein M8J76_007740 [Diaphorina citri]